jgi:hypothetical protein
MLRLRGIATLVLTEFTTDVRVHTTMREANDRGFECLLLQDCCGATDRSNHDHAIKMVKMQGGVLGGVSNSRKLIAAIEWSLPEPAKEQNFIILALPELPGSGESCGQTNSAAIPLISRKIPLLGRKNSAVRQRSGISHQTQ